MPNNSVGGNYIGNPSNMMAPEVIFTKNSKGEVEIILPAACYADNIAKKTKEQVAADITKTLGLYPAGMLVIREGKEDEDILKQCIEIMKRIKQTVICVDYGGSKPQKTININTGNINTEDKTINIYDDDNIAQIAELIKTGNHKAYIHLPNGILQVDIKTGEGGRNTIIKAKKFLPECIRAKRKEMRATLSKDVEIREFINLKSSTKSDYQLEITGGNGTINGIAMDISRGGIGFYCIGLPEDNIRPGTILSLKLLFLEGKEINVKIRKIAEGKGFYRFGAKIEFATDEEKDIIGSYIKKLDERLKQGLLDAKQTVSDRYINIKP